MRNARLNQNSSTYSRASKVSLSLVLPLDVSFLDSFYIQKTVEKYAKGQSVLSLCNANQDIVKEHPQPAPELFNVSPSIEKLPGLRTRKSRSPRNTQV